MIHNPVEFKKLLDHVYELRSKGASSSKIRDELSKDGLCLTDQQLRSLIRAVGT